MIKLPIKISFIFYLFISSNIINAFETSIDQSKNVSELSISSIDHFINSFEDYKGKYFKDNNDTDSNNIQLKHSSDSIDIYKKLAILNSELDNSEKAFVYAEKYIHHTLNFNLLLNESFTNIKDSKEYKLLNDKYLINVDFYSILYLCIAIVGLFFVIIINFKKESDRLSNALISGFVFIHSLFVLEYFFYITNIQFELPNSYLFSSSFALLYGPLFFLYFKRVTQNYVFKRIDILHFLPTIILLIFILYPIYNLDSSEKIKMMLNISKEHQNDWMFIFFPKFISMMVYGFLITKLHFFKNKYLAFKNHDSDAVNWERNIFRINIVYVFSYLIYGISISGLFGKYSFIIYTIHVVSMSAMIIYVSYMAFIKPKVFSDEDILIDSDIEFPKYVKSGLTDSLLKELSEKLIKLLIEDKVYKDSQISLESLSELIGTNRNNTSQIINECFNMNFFELINKFRVEEAINIFNSDRFGNLHIIDVAFEVGFNNKVTFNKAFKKLTSQTPSDYISTSLNRTKVIA